MVTLLMILLGQCVFAAAVVVVLLRLLDKELMNAAFEKLESCKSSTEIKELSVYSATTLSDDIKGRFESVRRRKFEGAGLNYFQNPELKGGVVIAAGDLLLDFSVMSRLQQFWS